MALLLLSGCSKSDDVSLVNLNENQLKSARVASIFGVTDNTSVLQTSVWAPPPSSGYRYSQWPAYDFTKYDLDNVYDASDYDLMTHFQYFSQEAVSAAVVEFTFPHIEYFVPHVGGSKQQRIYTVNNENNQTVITCTTDLVAGWNPMFCFIVKADCSKGNSGYVTIWTDMKVNGVSVKGIIKNKVFACN